jgi:alkylation response protein AidB-like acyl-CoA dehydrogenase
VGVSTLLWSNGRRQLLMYEVDDRTCSVGSAFALACKDVSFWPLPGGGATLRRLRLLAEASRRDVAVGRLVEAHADALAILAELGYPENQSLDEVQDQRWAVWAAGPADSLLGHENTGRWRLAGRKRWCSGGSLATHALVDALTDEGQRLFAVELSEPGVYVAPSEWIGAGMSRADTRTVDFVDVEAWPVGTPGSYLDRPGFWAGAIGVAACWHGATLSVSEALWAAAAKVDPHGLAHVGRVDVALTQNRAMLELAARRLDEQPDVAQPILARTVRATVASNATRVIDTVGRSLGPVPLAFDARHSQAVLDLQVYVRQEHAERDLEQLGTDLRQQGEPWIF